MMLKGEGIWLLRLDKISDNLAAEDTIIIASSGRYFYLSYIRLWRISVFRPGKARPKNAAVLSQNEFRPIQALAICCISIVRE